MSAKPAARRVDPDAYAALTRDAWPRLFQLALALCGDRDLAADLTQEALVRGFVAFDRFREGAAIHPWLARILRNTWIDHLRSARVRREVAGSEGAEPPDRRPAPDAAVLAGERARALYAALATLPDDLALAVTLIDLQGLSYQDAAAAMGTPVGTARSRLSRGRARLREALDRAGALG